MKLEQTWRWYGPYDTISLQEIVQTGTTGIVTALHHIPIGKVWTVDEIQKRKDEIEEAGLTWSVVESVPVHEDIKRKIGGYKKYIENYKSSIRNLAACGIPVICYNFMPVLDWTRTDLDYKVADNSTALRFEEPAIAAFDLNILKRKGAENDYSSAVLEKADRFMKSLDKPQIQRLTDTILAGLPGSEEGYSLDEFREILKTYKNIGEKDLRKNLYDFLREIVPVAEEAGIKLAIHPDDPPFSLFGLSRVVSTEHDARQLINVVDTPANGLTFCTGSYGARKDNDLPGMVKRLGYRINFIHLRSVQWEDDKTFHEANHLEGSMDMAAVMQTIIEEQVRRKKEGRDDLNIPMRPDHGHKMLDDSYKETAPGYSCIGRLRGLSELRGLEAGIRKALPAC